MILKCLENYSRTVQLAYSSITADIQELASREQGRKITSWRREKRWQRVERRDSSAIGDREQAACDNVRRPREPTYLTGHVNTRTFTSSKVHNLNINSYWKGVTPTRLTAQNSRVEFPLGTWGPRPETAPALSERLFLRAPPTGLSGCPFAPASPWSPWLRPYCNPCLLA